ncbi:MAG: PAS domain-containing protein [Pseudomonadota bacterium]
MDKKPTYEQLRQRIAELEVREQQVLWERETLPAIMAASPVPVVVVSVQGHITFANARAETLFHLTRSSLSTRTYDDPAWKITACDGQPLRDGELPFRKVAETLSPVTDVRHAIARPDGTRVQISVNAVPILDRMGRFDGMVATVTDITGQMAVLEKLKQSEENLRVTLQSIGDGVIATDVQGRVTRMNDVAQRLTGWSVEEALQQPLEEVFCIVNSKTREAVSNPAGKVLETGSIIGLANHTMLLSRDGREYQIADSAAPIRDSLGNTLGVVMVFRDVTEDYAKDNQIRESEAAYRSLMNNSPVGIFRTTSDGRALHVNPAMAAILGCQTSVEALENFKDLSRDLYVDPQRRNEFLKQLKNYGQVRNFEYEAVRRDSSRIWVSMNARISRSNPDGTFVIDGFAADVTEHKRMEEHLRRIDKMEAVGKLAGGIAHDFNNILMGIFGNISFAREELDSAHPAQVYLDRSEKAMKNATHLTGQLLTFASGGHPVKEVGTIQATIRETAEFNLAGSNVRLKFAAAPDLWPVDADQSQMAQVIANLVINARQAMPDGGELEISMENAALKEANPANLPQGRYVRIKVRDQGVGIPEQFLDKIYEPYFTTKQSGSGLGMSIVHSIIRRHDGYIGVSSTPGRGTVFELLLPASTEEAPSQAEDAGARFGGGSDDPSASRILLMDDDAAIREVSMLMLQRLGCSVDVVEDGKKAVAAYDSALRAGTPYAVVIVDLTVPGGMGGTETAARILALDSDATIVIASGYSRDPVMARYAEYGFRDVVVKPYTMEELKRKLKTLL